MSLFAMITGVIFIHLATIASAQATSTLEPYRTDSCSAPAGLTSKSWNDCCTAHDFSYWVGGSSVDKQRADAQFISCLNSKGLAAKIVAKVFELIPDRFTESHWGNRWHPRRPNSPLTDEELKQVQKYKGSFNLSFPIVQNPAGHECKKEIKKTAKTKILMSSTDNLLCFNLAKSKKGSFIREELVYSNQCLGYFLVQEDTSFKKINYSIEAFGDCKKLFLSESQQSASKRASNCTFSKPPMSEFNEIIAFVQTRGRSPH